MLEGSLILDRLILVLKREREEMSQVSYVECSEKTLDQLGLDSVALLSLLVAIEDEFGIEWSEDLPVATLRSLPSIAEFIGNELSATV